MAAPLGGMFSSQPPGAPPLPPGLPGQASLLQAAPSAPRFSPSTLVDELESSFEACFASLVSQDYVNGTDQEEIRTGVDQCIQKFLDIARQTECFFLQKKMAVICPGARAGYQRGCLGAAERAAAERRPGPEAPDQAAALAAGAGGHQRAAQEARRHPAGLPGPPRAGVCQHPRAYEADLRKSRRKGSLLGGMAFWKNSARE